MAVALLGGLPVHEVAEERGEVVGPGVGGVGGGGGRGGQPLSLLTVRHAAAWAVAVAVTWL